MPRIAKDCGCELRLEGDWRKIAVEVGETPVLKTPSTLAYALPPIGVSVVTLTNQED